ncbi:MAG: hypothetical protein R3B09_18420 [Nannocystaceae bacterium]
MAVSDLDIDRSLAAIQALVEAWLGFPGRQLDFSRRPPDAAPIPDALAATITRVEPYRSRVLADAALWSRLGVPPTGVGTEHILRPLPRPRPYDGWEHTLQPVALRVEWARTMVGLEVDYYCFALERLVHEDGEWRVAELYSDQDRETVRKVIEFLEGKHAAV